LGASIKSFAFYKQRRVHATHTLRVKKTFNAVKKFFLSVACKLPKKLLTATLGVFFMRTLRVKKATLF
jgi:hypothetical protein